MASFFNNIRSTFSNRENIIKENLLSNLSENVKEIQYELQDNTDPEPILNLIDCTNSLCTTIEAIFLHGLKDSFLRQTINVIAGTEVDQKPEPNFWPVLLIFSHKEIIQHIQSLSQITTDIGNCRAWIRYSLNDCLLSAYLTSIRKNISALSPYYKNHAFLRDNENLELSEKIIGGIEACVSFNLPCNSSLINQWTYHPLQMAGLYTLPLRSCPITSGIDVASSITNTEIIPTPKPVPINELFSESISNSPFANLPIHRPSDLTEDEHLQILLNKVDEIENNNTRKNNLVDVDTTRVGDETRNKVQLPLELSKTNETIYGGQRRNSDRLTLDLTHEMGNSILSKMGWSSTDDDEQQNIASTGTTTTVTEPMISRTNSMTTSINSMKTPLVERYSYNSLLVKHQNKNTTFSRTVDLKEIWDRFESSLGMADETGIIGKDSENNNNNFDSDDSDENLKFEILPANLTDQFSLKELKLKVEQLIKISREQGLDYQGFICKSCPNPLGIGFADAHVCAFDGCYYCNDCMHTDTFLIPARIIYNWDFKRYNVSKKTAAFLTEFQFQPFIDLKLLNPDIYMAVDEMSELQSLRIQLNFIRAYLFTCSETIIDKLQKLMWTKEYLYEHIHRYSLADLSLTPKRHLQQQLQKAVNFGREHIRDCALCSQKGFICEICNSEKVLYPFDVQSTFRCEICGAVYHSHCLNASSPCPKCERKRRREDLPLLEAVHSNA